MRRKVRHMNVFMNSLPTAKKRGTDLAHGIRGLLCNPRFSWARSDVHAEPCSTTSTLCKTNAGCTRKEPRAKGRKDHTLVCDLDLKSLASSCGESTSTQAKNPSFLDEGHSVMPFAALFLFVKAR